MADIDIAIIGSGVVGLAIAFELSKHYDNIFVFEKNERYGLETSSRNSGVIHSGIYYPENTLKSRLCIEGNSLIYKFCESHSIPYKKIGKIIVASDESEQSQLIDLYNHGQKIGVKEIRIIDKIELKRLEPHINAVMGILSKNTGIVDVHRLMDRLYNLCNENGVSFLFKMQLIKIQKQHDVFRLTFNNKESVSTRYLINSAGLYSDKVAEMAGIKDEYGLRYVKGSYFYYGKASPVSHLIYPLPQTNLEGLGIHGTIDLGGRLRFGPDTEIVDELNYQVEPSKRDVFFEKASRIIRGLDKDYFYPDTSGIRPKLHGAEFNDFIIKEESEREINGMINLIGIESPGLTCCLSIGKYVKRLVRY